jgi:hypothetical protein
MVLERLWRSKAKDEPLEINNPYAYSDDYEDCLSCRVLGTTRQKQLLARIILPDMLKRRFHGSGLARGLHLLYGHEEPKATAKSHRDEQIEVQIWVSAARDPHNICYAGRHGLIQNFQLRRPDKRTSK